MGHTYIHIYIDWVNVEPQGLPIYPCTVRDPQGGGKKLKALSLCVTKGGWWLEKGIDLPYNIAHTHTYVQNIYDRIVATSYRRLAKTSIISRHSHLTFN